LITIATRLYLDEKRKKKHEQNYVTNANALASNASRLLLWELEKQQSQWLTITEALAKLPDDQRTAILLQHYYGYTLQEIATMMQIPLGTVKSRIHYGMEQIRKEWERDEKRAKYIDVNK
jgi:RNA polymerase sigma-70 factor (ECF subfamily)